METQISGIENRPNQFSKKIGFCLLPVAISRGEELREEALRLQKEKEVQETSLKIFGWLKKTPESQISIITDWASYNMPEGAIRLEIIRTEVSKNLLIKVSGVIGSASYTIGQTWNLRNSPKALEEKIKRALQERVRDNKNEKANLVLTKMRLEK